MKEKETLTETLLKMNFVVFSKQKKPIPLIAREFPTDLFFIFLTE